MKVIFYKDVPGVAKKFDVKNVSDGYAFNFLLPRNLALRATAEELARLEAKKNTEIKAKKDAEAVLLKNLKKITNLTVTITEDANEKGHLFKGIHKDQLVAEIKTQGGLDIAEDFIVLEKPVKDVGEHKIEVRAGDKNAFFTLSVVAK